MLNEIHVEGVIAARVALRRRGVSAHRGVQRSGPRRAARRWQRP